MVNNMRNSGQFEERDVKIEYAYQMKKTKSEKEASTEKEFAFFRSSWSLCVHLNWLENLFTKFNINV